MTDSTPEQTTVNCGNCDGQNLADAAEQRGYCYNCSFPLEVGV